MGEIPHLAPRESIVIECDCGERPALTASATTRGGGGADHEAVVQEGLEDGRLGD